MTVRSISTVSKVLGCQFFVIVLSVIGCIIFQGRQSAISSLLGGLAAFIPNLFFGWQVLRVSDRAARKILNNIYIGEVGKWVLTIALFVSAFNVPNIEIFPLLATYVMAISVFWFALLMR